MYALSGVLSPMFAHGHHAEVKVLVELLLELAGVKLVVVVRLEEVPEGFALGGRGVTTTSHGRGPPVSPPLVQVVLVVLLLLALL